MSGSKSRLQPVIFLDRDGVLNEDLGYIHTPEQIEIIAGVPEALQILSRLGYALVVVTNQSAVARGICSEDDVRALNDSIKGWLQEKYEIVIDAFYYCPHHPAGSVKEYTRRCSCRKPGTLLVEKAILDLSLDTFNAFFIGDKKSDIACGKASGMKTIQVLGRYPKHPEADYYVSNLLEAAQLVASVINK